MSLLIEGSIVEVIAPGYKCDELELKNGLNFLESWGVKYRIHNPIFGEDLLSSNSTQERFTQLKNALVSKDSRVIWCVRGGYGSIHLLPFLAQLKVPKTPKVIVGLSDITSLQSAVYKLWGWKSVHGPLLDRLGNRPVEQGELSLLKDLFFKDTVEILTNDIEPINKAARDAKVISGVVLGGNLTVYQSLIGTPFMPSSSQKILFFEDIGERGYRVDRMLHQLSQSQKLRSAKALIFGEFTGGLEPATSPHANTSLTDSVIHRFAQSCAIPCFRGFPSGHGHIQRPLIFGLKAEITKNKSYSFRQKSRWTNL